MAKLAINGGPKVTERVWPRWPIWGREEREALLGVLESGEWWYGEKVRRFEEAFSRFQDAKYGVTCSSGTAALEAAIQAVEPDLVLMIATAMGKDLAARVAARMKMATLTDCISIDEVEGSLQAVKSMYGGKVFATLQAVRTPVMATLRPSAYPVPEPSGGEAPVTPLAVTLPAEPKARVVQVLKAEEGTLDVQEADVVVSGGRGLKDPANFNLIEGLAGVLGGAVGASRAAVDAGWIDHAHQVGQTGKTVSPKLYVAVGISGAIQHLAGMRTAKCILAVNKDPDAPIFGLADYGIVGDLFKVVPLLTAEIEKAKA